MKFEAKLERQIGMTKVSM